MDACLLVLLLAVGAGLVLYSQTNAFAWDEGFHVLCAQLILRGKLPYIDFVFSQTPLNSFWNALWMKIFGDTWRTVHAVAALWAAGAIFLTADYVRSRFSPVAAFGVTALMGGNVLIVQFGTVGQAYGLCLLLTVGAFRFAVRSEETRSLLAPLAAGLLAGASANASLLTAPVVAVLLVWFLRQGAGKTGAFLAGVIVSSLPLLVLALKDPVNVWFGIFEYNFLYRGVRWGTATQNNIGVYFSWVDSSHALVLMILAAVGLGVTSRSEDKRRPESLLCFWLAVALTVHISTARPTFTRYYLFVVPFLCILAAPVLDRPRRVAALALFVILGLTKTLYEDRDDWRWSDVEEIGRKVDEVTPRGAPLAADEHVYFVTRRLPPPGMELADARKLEFAEARARRLHLLPEPVFVQRIKEGAFATVQTCRDSSAFRSEFDRSAGFPALDCYVFWQRRQ